MAENQHLTYPTGYSSHFQSVLHMNQRQKQNSCYLTHAYKTAVLLHGKPWAWASRSEGDTKAGLLPYTSIRCFRMCRCTHVLCAHTFPSMSVCLCVKAANKVTLGTRQLTAHILGTDCVDLNLNRIVFCSVHNGLWQIKRLKDTSGGNKMHL